MGPKATQSLAETMVKSLSHRGPDDSGIYQDGDTFLGHTRLSIIDLKTGQQPMCNEDRSIWIVFNGEVYNFRKLRKELEKRDHDFHSNSDTEVILHGYEEYGLDFLPQLDGIFAFALWDSNQHQLLLVRDYFGVKPLHYYYDGQTFYFASEIKAILQDPSVPRQVDFQAMHYFMNVRYIPGERTLFQGIRRLLAAHFMIFSKGVIRTDRYYTLKPESNAPRKESDCLEGTRHYLKAAVKKQLTSDVPLGVYLSGGLDSSSIVAFMSELVDKPIQTFCLGFNEPSDELRDAQVIADHFSTNHHQMILSPDPMKSYPEVIWHVEEPKVNILQGYLLSKFASQHVKAVHGGLGGDELFAGYQINRYLYRSQPFHRFVPEFIRKGIMQPLSRLICVLANSSNRLSFDEYRRGAQILLSLGDPERCYLMLRNTWDYDKAAFPNLYGPALKEKKLNLTHSQFDTFFTSNDGHMLDRVLWAEFQTKMIDDFLLNEDRTSMAHGLEIRAPFLDRDLVRFAMGIPLNLKINHKQSKYIFRKAMTGLLPDHAIQKKKWGFTFDPYYQFQKDFKKTAERILTKQRVESRGWFNYKYLTDILKHRPHPRLRWHYFFLWMVLGLEIWCQMFLEGDPIHPELDIEAYYAN